MGFLNPFLEDRLTCSNMVGGVGENLTPEEREYVMAGPSQVEETRTHSHQCESSIQGQPDESQSQSSLLGQAGGSQSQAVIRPGRYKPEPGRYKPGTGMCKPEPGQPSWTGRWKPGTAQPSALLIEEKETTPQLQLR